MRPPIKHVPEPGILLTAIALYTSAIGWALIWGPDSFVVGVLSGCGSISLGIWLGVIVVRHPELLPGHHDED